MNLSFLSTLAFLSLFFKFGLSLINRFFSPSFFFRVYPLKIRFDIILYSSTGRIESQLEIFFFKVLKLKPRDLSNLDLNLDFGKISKKVCHSYLPESQFLMSRSVPFLLILFEFAIVICEASHSWMSSPFLSQGLFTSLLRIHYLGTILPFNVYIQDTYYF